MAPKSIVKGDIIFSDSILSPLADKAPTLKIAEGVIIKGSIHLHQYVKVVLPDSISPDIVVKHYQ
jgi:hypothetical protein